MDLRDTPEYREFGYQIVTCPVCGQETLDHYWICEHCGWEYDGTVEENEWSDANKDMIAHFREKQKKQTKEKGHR